MGQWLSLFSWGISSVTILIGIRDEQSLRLDIYKGTYALYIIILYTFKLYTVKHKQFFNIWELTGFTEELRPEWEFSAAFQQRTLKELVVFLWLELQLAGETERTHYWTMQSKIPLVRINFALSRFSPELLPWLL